MSSPRREIEILDDPEAGDMSSTHGGNPVCAAAALASLQVLEEEQLVAAAESTGKLVLDSLNGLAEEFPDHILSIHGPGLFIGVHIRSPDTGELDVELADAIVLESMRRGVLMFLTGRGFLKFTPPLGIDPEAALEAAEVIKECFRERVAALG